jgi:hypothetical protein
MLEEDIDVTSFGTVTSDRLICNSQQWQCGGMRQKEVPLRDVTNARLEIKRHRILGISLVLVALVVRVIDSSWTLITIIPIAVGVLLLWGLPSVRVNTTDGDLPPARGLPWNRSEAEWFVATVNRRRQ